LTIKQNHVLPGLIQQTSKARQKRSNVYGCSDSVVDWQQHLERGIGLQCLGPVLASGKYLKQHPPKIQLKEQYFPPIVHEVFLPEAAGWPV
jgi:hypothetical protein